MKTLYLYGAGDEGKKVADLALRVGASVIRKIFYQKIRKKELNIATLTYPGYIRSIDVKIGIGTIIGGNTSIGENTYIGSGAVLRDDIHIGNNCIIGMGAVVTKSVGDNMVMLGNLAKFYEKTQVKEYLKMN